MSILLLQTDSDLGYTIYNCLFPYHLDLKKYEHCVRYKKTLIEYRGIAKSFSMKNFGDIGKLGDMRENEIFCSKMKKRVRVQNDVIC